MVKRKRVFGYVSLLFIFCALVCVGIVLYNHTNIFAKIAPKEYEITFVVDGKEYVQKEWYGTLPEFEGNVYKSSTPAKEFVFKGWAPAIESVSKNKTYTAIYDEIDRYYDISIGVNMLSAGRITGEGKYKYGEQIELKVETNYGYEFIGWHDSENNRISSDDTLSIEVVENKIYFALFSFVNGTIEYETYFEDIENDNVKDYNVSLNSFKLKPLEAKGYDFNGWFTEENGKGEKIESIDTSVIKDYHLYAYWTLTNYTISYNLNGGTIIDSNPVNYTIEDSITLNNPFKPDGRFIGWLGTGLNSPTMEVTIPKNSTGDRVYIANFFEYDKVVSIYVDNKMITTLSVRPGTQLSDEMIKEYLDERGFILNGYDLDGWYEDSDFTSPFNMTSKVSRNIELYGKSNYQVNRLYFYSYIEEFDKAVETEMLEIESMDKLLAWIDYVRFYDISVVVKLNLSYLENANESQVEQELASEYENLLTLTYFNTNSEIEISSIKIDEQVYGLFYIKKSNWSEQASLTLDREKEEVYQKLDYALKIKNKNNRPSDYNEFKLNNIEKSLRVWTTEQLYYAVEQGYKPECESGSVAELVLNEIKKILIDICNDKMTDVEKLRAIYEWFGLNVYYDNKAQNLEDTLTYIEKVKYDSYFVEGAILNRVATDEGFAKAFVIMAKMEGIPTIYVGDSGCAWNKVCVNSRWYVVDSSSIKLNVILDNITSEIKTFEVINHSTFLIADRMVSTKKYITKMYIEFPSYEDYDYYSKQSFDLDNNQFGLKVFEKQDLSMILQYADTFAQNSTDQYVSIEFLSSLPLVSNLLNILYSAQVETGVELVRYLGKADSFSGKTIYIMLVKNKNFIE